MGDEIRIFVPGEPVAKARPESSVARDGAGNALRSAKTGHMVVRHYTPAKTRAYENLVGLLGNQAMAGRAPMVCAVELRVLAVMPVPASWPKVKRAQALAGELWPTSRPDLDNILKAIKDGLNGVAWVDDAQVVQISAAKMYGPTPGVSIVVAAAKNTCV